MGGAIPDLSGYLRISSRIRGYVQTWQCAIHTPTALATIPAWGWQIPT